MNSCSSSDVPMTTTTITTTTVVHAIPATESAAGGGQQATSCNAPDTLGLNKTVCLVTAGVCFSLLLVYLIVSALRHFYKPIRPRIKKTFVVRNKMDRSKNRTPLTCRPAPEQCEITIEDCCNMNICDTVSVDDGK